jgi:ribosome modulation factor
MPENEIRGFTPEHMEGYCACWDGYARDTNPYAFEPYMDFNQSVQWGQGWNRANNETKTNHDSQ